MERSVSNAYYCLPIHQPNLGNKAVGVPGLPGMTLVHWDVEGGWGKKEGKKRADLWKQACEGPENNLRPGPTPCI